MRTIELNTNTRGRDEIVIGHRGENGAAVVIFDAGAWAEDFGEGVISLLVKRWGDENAYPVALDTADHIATWTVSGTDTDIEGTGAAEFRYTVGGVIVKSAVFRTRVLRDIGAATDTPPDPYDSWLESLMALAAETETNASAAADSAADASRSAAEAEAWEVLAAEKADAAETARKAAVKARTAAETAQGNAEESAAAAQESATDAQTALQGMVYVTFSVNADGHVLLGNGDLTGTTSFELTTAGHMEVTY